MPESTWRTVRWTLLALFVAGVASAHSWYGNRHHFFDLGIYRQAVRWWLDGHQLYAFSRPDDTQGQLGFTYPPFGALVLVPLGVLPEGAAIALYAALTLGAVALTTYWLVAPVVRRRGGSLAFALVLALTVISALEPMRETFTFGQINMLLVVLVLADLLVLWPRQSRWTGAGIGLAAAIKLTPAIFIPYLLLSRRPRATAVAVASAGAASLAAAALAPRASWDYWSRVLWRGEGLGNAAYTFNQSLYGMLARYASPGRPDRALWAALVLAAVILGLGRARRAALRGDEVTGLTLTGLAGALASPITWAHHLYWFVPALVVLADAALPAPDPALPPARRWAFGGLAALVALTVGLGLVSWFELGLPVEPWGRGLPGFLIRNWYMLLCALLLLALPIRGARPAALTAPPQAGTIGA